MGCATGIGSPFPERRAECFFSQGTNHPFEEGVREEELLKERDNGCFLSEKVEIQLDGPSDSQEEEE